MPLVGALGRSGERVFGVEHGQSNWDPEGSVWEVMTDMEEGEWETKKERCTGVRLWGEMDALL